MHLIIDYWCIWSQNIFSFYGTIHLDCPYLVQLSGKRLDLYLHCLFMHVHRIFSMLQKLLVTPTCLYRPIKKGDQVFVGYGYPLEKSTIVRHAVIIYIHFVNAYMVHINLMFSCTAVFLKQFKATIFWKNLNYSLYLTNWYYCCYHIYFRLRFFHLFSRIK